MGLTEPLLIAVGIAGVIFMISVFKLKARARMLAISAVMVITILLGNRLLNSPRTALNPSASSSASSLWDLVPFANPSSPDLVARTGWQDLPLDVLGIFLAALGSQPVAPSVSPTPVLPLPAPLPALPLPASPALIPTPFPSPTIPASPTVPPIVSQPSPQPNPQPSFRPVPVQPSLQPSPAQPYAPYEPFPRPAPAPAPPVQPPISAWW